MTTTVTVEAHCAAALYEVLVSVTGQPDTVLQDGGKISVYAYDKRVISVKEVSKDRLVMPPHQQRVLDEKAELDDKLSKLLAFFETPMFGSLVSAEQDRLRHQSTLMGGYSAVLEQRIDAFSPV